MPFRLPKRVLKPVDCCCCRPYFRLAGILNPESGDPPVLSDYCVYWGLIPGSIFFPCVEGSDVNGNTSQGELCGGNFTIPDFQEAGNVFFYDQADGLNSYAQVIKPAANTPLTDLGYYAFEVFGNPSGPIPIDITQSNCFVNCYTSTFDVDDVNEDGLTGLTFNYEGEDIDLTVLVPFSDPGAAASIVSQIVGWFEPSVEVEISFVGNTVTMVIRTIMTPIQGLYGTAIIDKETFDFEPCS